MWQTLITEHIAGVAAAAASAWFRKDMLGNVAARFDVENGNQIK